jgi:hypothetical protein
MASIFKILNISNKITFSNDIHDIFIEEIFRLIIYILFKWEGFAPKTLDLMIKMPNLWTNIKKL